MISLKEVAEKTYAMDARIAGVQTPFTVYFIAEGRGLLIEPGPTALIPSIQESMKRLGMSDLAYVVPTHIHMDHAGAIGSVAQLFPRAKVLLHPLGAKHALDPSRLIESTRMAFGDDFERFYGPILAVRQSQVVTPSDGEIFSINGRDLRVIHTPGHAPHHLSIFDQKTKGLFPGEALGIPTPGAILSPVPAAAPPSFDLEDYLKTMEKLRRLRPEVLFYSHDGVGRNPEELISAAVANTKMVAERILKALEEGMPDDAIRSRLRQELGVEEDMSVTGFILYFKKRGTS